MLLGPQVLPRKWKRSGGIGAALAALLTLVATVGGAVPSGEAPEVSPEGGVVHAPDKIVGSDSCARCHAAELAVWRQSRHSLTYLDLHRQPRAKEIAERMGITSIKRGGICVDCHYTRQSRDGGSHRVVEGVSCEMCHGAAKDWLPLHNDYGGPTATKQSESAEHAMLRIEKSIGAGMWNPRNPYMIARSCMNCHTVPNERLVNVGGHVAGSRDFELVRWSQGMQRHNFLRSPGVNSPSSPERLRVMYIVGVMADLEYSLRAVAKAEERKPFALATAERAAEMRQRLVEVHERTGDPLVLKALEAAYSAGLRLNNSTALTAAADSLSEIAYEMGERDGADLADVDPLVPTPETYLQRSRRQ
ncbi:MAG: cytochrome c family protein [Planctomycetales bacterium]|nr:cytochrome c family protein [Planctomycetales bacterium]